MNDLEIEKGPPKSQTVPVHHQRQSWTGKLDFLVSLIGSAVGLGNVWRFPFLCYRNGGGTFLIPYFICLFLLAIPQLLLEVTVGQLLSRGAIGIWNICPIMKGCGFFYIVLMITSIPAYLTVIVWAFYFTCQSFRNPLPWSSCINPWNTQNCSNNITANISHFGATSTTEFWEYNVIGLTNGITETGRFQWHLYLCCLAICILVFFSVCRGVSISGKVMYPLTILPYILLFALIGFTATMKGSSLGLYFLFTPHWSSLGKVQVWADAGRQVFYSLSVGSGISIGLSSHNQYQKRSYIDCLITAVINSATSLLAALVIFMTLGFMSIDADLPIDKVADSGVGLAFVTYPLVLMRMPVSQLWSVIFFLMLTCLGLSSLITSVESLFSATSDIFPMLGVKKSRNRLWATFLFCILLSLLTLTFMFGNGMYLILLLEFFNGNRTLFIVSICLCLTMVHSVGATRFSRAVERMYRIKTSKLLIVLWGFVGPLILMFILISNIVAYTQLSFRRGSTGQTYHFPSVSLGLGWCLEIFEFVLIPGCAIYMLCRRRGSFIARLKDASRPQLTEEQYYRLMGETVE